MQNFAKTPKPFHEYALSGKIFSFVMKILWFLKIIKKNCPRENN